MNLKIMRIILFMMSVIIGSSCGVALAENIDPNNDDSQYAYGENAGWINFEPGGNAGSGAEVSGSQVTGYAWAENVGWIKLNPAAGGGVVNDGNGNLSGYGWGENVGWINFKPTGGGVVIDTNGDFNGQAWGENIGWIHFNNTNIPYKVQTSWKPLMAPTPTPAPTPVPSPTPISGPIACYSFEEVSGTTALDSVDGNHGTINGATRTPGKVGGGLSFDGNDFAQIPGLLGQPQNITISAWTNLYASDTSGAEVISLGDHVAVRLDNIGGRGVTEFYYDGTTWRSTTTGIMHAGTGWHHVVYVIDDTNNIQRVYIDGVQKGSTAYTQSISYTGLGVNSFMGKHGNGGTAYDFKGLIDEVCVYNKVLSAQEVLDLYNQSSSGLVSHWQLDEGIGTTAIDSIDGNNGIINGAAWTTGVSGDALSLDGVNDYIDLGNPSNLQPGTVSLSVWFKTTATGGMIMRKRLYGYGLEVLPAGNISFWIYTADAAKFTATSSKAYNDNIWHHAVGVYGGSMVRLYIDGSPAASASAGTIFYGTGAIAIGRDGNAPGSYFKGLVDDVRIFQGELSAQEVLDLYYQSSGLVSHWKFEEGSGTNATDSVDGNNGTIVGATWTPGMVGGGLGFDGNDFVQIAGLLGQSQNTTISAWTNLSASDTSGAEVISLGDHVAVRLDNTGGRGVTGFYYDGTTWRSTTTGIVHAGTGWHHVVYVIDDANNLQRIYIDGVQKGSTAHTQSISYAGLGSNTFIGKHGNNSGNYDFNGIIDDVRVYHKVLSAEEVQGLYNNVSALATRVSHGFMSSNNGDTYTSVTPPGAAVPIYPTTDTVRSFKAEADGGRVILTWETVREDNIAGFNVYRSRRKNGAYNRVNNAPIDAKGDAIARVSYCFEDKPGDGKFYYYKLEDVNYRGLNTMHGPVKVRMRR